MSDTLAAVPLDPTRIGQAYPVVHAMLPALDLETWHRFASRLIQSRDPAEGVMTAQAGGYIRGLFCHWWQPNLKHGDLLVVDAFSVLDMFDPHRAAKVLIDAMEKLAEAVRCQAIHTVLPHTAQPVSELAMTAPFRSRGHQPSSLVLCKSFAAQTEPPACRVTSLEH